jgi:hypothetical protein
MDPEESTDANKDEEAWISNAVEAGGRYEPSVGFLGHSIGPLETTELSDRLKDRSAPDWASSMLNCRGMVAWDSNQYIACVGIEDKLVEALLDTGGCCSLMDMGMARRLKLPYVE